MSTKHMVGGVDRRGQQNAVFATLMDLVKRIMISSLGYTGKASRVHCTVNVENYARVHRIDEL